jgi:hypothetical protein
MPRATPHTLLPLADYAKILGLDPLHFSGGVSELRPAPQCSDVWYQYDWQDADKVSRHQLAILLKEAEDEIANTLGYWPAPIWIEDERHDYTRLYRPEMTGVGQDIRFRFRSVQTKYGKVITGGRRATEPIDLDATFTTLDTDGDSFNETAQFIIANQSATLDVCEVHAYFKVYNLLDNANTRTDPSSQGADPAWEVRPLRTRLVGTDLYVWCYVWDLFRPQLYEELAPDPINADAAGSFVDELSFYRVYNDPAEPVEFLWGTDISCADTDECEWSSQDGCIRVANPHLGLVVPAPATYDATTGDFTSAAWVETYEPNVVRLWYYAGDTERTASCQTLSQYWARIIAMLATTRSDWPICTCSNKNNILLSSEWRANMQMVKTDRSFFADAHVLGNPFGPRVGEVEAWKRIARARGRMKGQAVIT